MSITNFIKKLVTLDALFGAQKKKIAGINDRYNYLLSTSVIFDSLTNTITFPLLTSMPSWFIPGKFIRTYSGLQKVTTDSQSLTYVADVILTPNPANNEGVKFLILRVTGNVVTLNSSYSTCVSRVISSDFTIDGRIAIATNDELINRINAYGATVFNTQAQSSTGDGDGSAISLSFADHFHTAPPSYKSHYNNTDGNNDATVTPFGYSAYYVGTSLLDLYGAGGWNNQATHPCTNLTSVSYYNNSGKCTDLQGGTVTVLISYYDNTNTLQSATHSIALDGTAKDSTLGAIRITITALEPDSDKIAGYITTYVDYSILMPNGGRVVSITTTHLDASANSWFFTYSAGVFYDSGPTPPTQDVPTGTIATPFYIWLSGIRYYTTGTTLIVQNTFYNVHNEAFVGTPYIYNAASMGFGSGTLTWNDLNIVNTPGYLPGISPNYNSSNALNLTLSMSANVCTTGGSLQTQVRDPWNTSAIASDLFNNFLAYNRDTSSTRNMEDFRREVRRLQARSDNTAPADRDLGNWDSTGNLGIYDDTLGLQVIPCDATGCDGILAYPSINYTGYDPVGLDYSGLVGTRYYYRFFSNSSGVLSHSGGVVRIDCCGSTLSEADLIAGNVLVEVMLCDTDISNRTLWLSLNSVRFNDATFNPLSLNIDDRRCRTMLNESGGATTAPDFGFTLSSTSYTRFTKDTSNYGVMVRIGLPVGSTLKIAGVTLVSW